MMRSAAVICETNPFHKGHLYLFDQVRAGNVEFLQEENNKSHQKTTDVTIAVMSGNFVQRGLPAVLDKYTRARILLTHGVDLVVELPFPWCAAGGEAFAAGGVAVAAGLGAHMLTFGSESGAGDMLTRCGAWLDSAAARERMLAMEKEEPGIGAAQLHERLCLEGGFTLKPNDKLAVWYLRQRMTQHIPLVPALVKRLPHSETVISATKIREKLALGEAVTSHVPDDLASFYETTAYTSPEKFYDVAHLFFRLHGHTLTDTTGLYARLTEAAYHSRDGREFMEMAATKKYTHARIRRSILFAMTDCPEPDTVGVPGYTILLGANEKGRAYLSERRKNSTFPILTKPAHGYDLPADIRQQFLWLTRGDSLYGLCMPQPTTGDFFLKAKPVIL